jgi:hypothetical protein
MAGIFCLIDIINRRHHAATLLPLASMFVLGSLFGGVNRAPRPFDIRMLVSVALSGILALVLFGSLANAHGEAHFMLVFMPPASLIDLPLFGILFTLVASINDLTIQVHRPLTQTQFELKSLKPRLLVAVVAGLAASAAGILSAIPAKFGLLGAQGMLFFQGLVFGAILPMRAISSPHGNGVARNWPGTGLTKD